MSLELAAVDKYVLVVAYLQVSGGILIPAIIVSTVIFVKVWSESARDRCSMPVAIWLGLVVGCIVSLLWLAVLLFVGLRLCSAVYGGLRDLYDPRPG